MSMMDQAADSRHRDQGDEAMSTRLRQDEEMRRGRGMSGTEGEPQDPQQGGVGGVLEGVQQSLSGLLGGSQDVNVGQTERLVSIAAGSILALGGLSRRSLPGLIIAGVGGAMLYRGLSGHCHAYSALGLNTAQEGDAEAGYGAQGRDIATRGVLVEESFLINRGQQELYDYWRDFTNLPRIMTYLEEVRLADGDGRRSHWVAKAPAIAGGKVEWDAELTRDEPGELIEWRSLPGSEIDTVGQVRFERALGDRGTIVHVAMQYVPPAGKLGHLLAKMFGKAPDQTIREDLRNFKRVMETGEIPSTEGQPRGTCTGQGKREAQ